MPDLPAPSKDDRLPLTAEEMMTAYRKLCTCLDELDALRPDSIRSPADERPFTGWVKRYNLTIDGIYGHGSTQCDQYCILHLGPSSEVTPSSDTDFDAVAVTSAYAAGIANVRKRIISILDDHAEKLEALGAASKPTG